MSTGRHGKIGRFWVEIDCQYAGTPGFQVSELDTVRHAVDNVQA
jgi:hypothetical protein